MPSQNVQQIIDRILASPRAQASSAFAGRVYTDEPILRRGSQMANYLPEPCQKMRELARSREARTKPEAWVFYHQALLMESYEDDVWYSGAFEHYFPTYQTMNDRQLRGYFTWRASVRRGAVKATKLSYVFVFLYELLCGIGIDQASGLLGLWRDPAELAGEEAAGEAATQDLAAASALPSSTVAREFASLSRAERGFRLLEAFWQTYRPIEPRLSRYLLPWLRDYAIWHGLDQAFLAPYFDLARDRPLIQLRTGIAAWDIAAKGAPQAAEAALAEALEDLSSYRLRVSRLGKDRPETLRNVSCSVVCQLARYYDAHRKSSLMDSLFGAPLVISHVMFAFAVFWSDAPHADAVYELSEANRYTCVHGDWYWEGYYGTSERSGKLGAILHACDQRLRAAVGYKHPLKEKPVPKYLAKIIDRAIEERLGWEREQEARAIHVDLSQLAGIRAAASSTREALLIDEEREDTPRAGELAARTEAKAPASPTGEHAAAADTVAAGTASAAAVAATGSAPFGLTTPELALLGSLLRGNEPEVPAHTSLDMLVDGINDKLFDLLGDTALEYLSGTPTIIEDYRADIREALAHE